MKKKTIKRCKLGLTYLSFEKIGLINKLFIASPRGSLPDVGQASTGLVNLVRPGRRLDDWGVIFF